MRFIVDFGCGGHRSLFILFFVFCLCCLRGHASHPRQHRRDLLRVRDLPSRSGDDHHPTPTAYAAVDLDSSNFDAILSQSIASFAVVEFFAHWCPACRNYKPQYDKVARLFNGPDAIHPGIIIMARVDCADKMNTKLCDRFSVGHYPMLLWGSPSKFASGEWNLKENKNGIRLVDDWRTAEQLLNWINKQIGSSFSLDDERYKSEDKLPLTFYLDQIDRAVYDVEEATSQAFDIILGHKMIKPSTRSSLIKFLQLLVVHHPSKRCRGGSAEILINFNDLWPRDILSASLEDAGVHHVDALKDLRICGKEVPRGYWMFCRGSRNETRGFSCGLWVLLHSLTIRVEDGESHLAFTAMCDFIHNFFICEECRRHFYEMCSRVSVPFNTSRDLSLWLWGAHNEVNQRLMKVEKDLKTEDPKFPKIIWPPKQLCGSCYSSKNGKSSSSDGPDWAEDEVYKFLVKYYGHMLVASYKDAGPSSFRLDESRTTEEQTSSTNAVVLPLGAALAIALASCVFGALACFWRTQQKNRKQKKSRS